MHHRCTKESFAIYAWQGAQILANFQGCSKHSRRFAGLKACFLLVTVGCFLFLFDKFRLKHLLKHVNKIKNREDCFSVPETCKPVVFRFF